MKVVFSPTALDHVSYWTEANPKMVRRIFDLIKEIRRTPYEGKGNPEALKHEWSGYWSRRIDQEHRLIYRITEDEPPMVYIASAKGHY
jgi:toxin YoeB